jgi:thiamine pyrophosphate-dependent acetolactate synthase large subunit-like protein
MALLQRGDVGSSSGLQPPRDAKDVKVIQLDIAPEEIGHNKATEVALVGDGKAIVGQLNQALAGRASGSIRRTRFQADATPYLGPDFHRLDRTSFVWRTHSIHLVVSAGATIAVLVSWFGQPLN